MSQNQEYSVSEDARKQVDGKQKCEKNRDWAMKVNDGTVQHSFDDAINMDGNGWYSISLLGILSLTTLAMGMDMFGFSVVVTGATCDLNLNLQQTSILLSMAFIGPIVTSYTWGYISDTQGRRKSLLIALWVSFIVSTFSAFSHHWTVMAILKFVSTSFSSCAQSATYTLLGESCPQRVRDGYMLIMTSVLDFMLAVYIAIGYGILNLDFSYNLFIITFVPWRLLVLVLASTLGLAALGVHFFYESPKFLLNAGKEDDCLHVLKGIWKWNGGKSEEFKVTKVYLNETEYLTSYTYNDGPLWRSLWNGVVPLFKLPLLWRSLQLYLLTAIVYGTSNAYFVWFPLLAQKFFESSTSSSDGRQGLCSLIVSAYNNDTKTGICSFQMDTNVVWSSLIQGLVFVTILFGLSKIAHRKRIMMIILLLNSSLCGLGAVLIPHDMISFIMFFGQLSNELVIGVIYSYFVDLYPTSHRGMATCLGTMVARTSSLGFVNLFGAIVMTHCTYIFYFCSGLIFCAVLLSLLLPPDELRK